MYIFSELIEAQLEGVDALPAVGKKGKIVYHNTDDHPHVDIGSKYEALTLHGESIINDTRESSIYGKTANNHAEFRDAIHAIGEVKTSMMDLAQFQAAYTSNWVFMDGSILDATVYTELAALRPEWVSGSDITLPDARSTYLRMKSNSRSDGNENPDGEQDLGAYQADEFEEHKHEFATSTVLENGQYGGRYFSTTTANSNKFVKEAGGNETRPKTTIVNFFIKVQ